MSRKTFCICMAVILAVFAGLMWWAFSDADTEETWDASYEMTNRRIEWTGAGYGGR